MSGSPNVDEYHFTEHRLKLWAEEIALTYRDYGGSMMFLYVSPGGYVPCYAVIQALGVEKYVPMVNIDRLPEGTFGWSYLVVDAVIDLSGYVYLEVVQKMKDKGIAKDVWRMITPTVKRKVGNLKQYAMFDTVQVVSADEWIVFPWQNHIEQKG